MDQRVYGQIDVSDSTDIRIVQNRIRSAGPGIKIATSTGVELLENDCEQLLPPKPTPIIDAVSKVSGSVATIVTKHLLGDQS